MKIDKNTDGIVQLSNGDYELNIDIISTETIEIDLDDRLLCKSIKSEQSIIVKKGIKAGSGIEAGWDIKAGSGIEAGEGIEAGFGIKASGIEAGFGIKAGWDIKAGEGIKAGWDIKAGWGIKAGWDIKAGWGIKAGEGIKAGLGIKAGSDYLIFAGISTWKTQNIDKTITATEIIGGKIAYGDFVKIEKLAEPISEIQDEEIELNGKKYRLVK